ncbi:hypothetical protein LNP18_06415 [Leuconostoc citreum]|uniref:hypothetical protein n=1 Tax=Leuconostoc citreum TaxID=33964 RepID=UPI00200AB014|nr:hypothetical protein [Leuconostoc citreum]MCK8605737.1 hypothetical protein [Leuconostoc citreum]
MSTSQNLTGYITAITKAPEVVVLSFQEKGQSSALALTIDAHRYFNVFPAGDPELNVEVIAVIEHHDNDIIVTNVYNPNGDFIAADELPELEAWDADSMSSEEQDVYERLKKEREHFLASVFLSDEELAELAGEHEFEKRQQPERIDYGNPVTGEGGRDE